MLTSLKSLGRMFLGATAVKLPVVCIFGGGSLALSTPVTEEYEETRLDCRCYPADADLESVLVQDRPHVIITSGPRSAFPALLAAPCEVRRRWLHYDTLPDRAQLGVQAFGRYLENLLADPGREAEPLVTVFTAAYRPGDRIRRPFHSLLEQSYGNWEWVVVDDSDDGGRTFAALERLAETDHRIRIFRAGEHSGVIGRVKRWACGLGDGPLLVELDHDDELTDTALEMVVRGFAQYPDAGFLYTDCAEVAADQTNITYRNGWAFGYGAYTDVLYRGRLYKSGSGGNINAKTIRHVVSAPNHLRAWRRSCYQAIGGHNPGLHVADDFELLVRTFLATRMVRIPRLGYIQHAGHTTQESRNRDIHRHVRAILAHYDLCIHRRLLALGCEDFSWDEARGCSDYRRPNPMRESHATLIAAV